AHQLRADPQPVVRSQDRACQHDIYREFSRHGSEVGAPVAYLAVLRLDRTTSDSSPDSALAITSARLKLKYSISGSVLSKRKGNTANRVMARASVTTPPASNARGRLND